MGSPSALRTLTAARSLTAPPTSRLCPSCRQRVFGLRYAAPDASPTSLHAVGRRRQSTWAQAVSTAQSLLGPGRRPTGVAADPLAAVGTEMQFLTANLRKLVGSGHPMLDTVSKYYTQAEGKHMRPMLVLLMARATARCEKAREVHARSDIDAPISPSSILADVNPATHSVDHPLVTAGLDGDAWAADADVLPAQRRLAEITELIHTASLLHDDVIDHAESRRSAASANLAFGNKMAVLAGDFLLGRASAALARLRDAEVIELLATVIANLVEGEFMQLQNTAAADDDPRWTPDVLAYYLQKTYLKSAALISKSCRAAALLGAAGPAVADAAYLYGKHLGLAFQLVDDLLDYTTSSTDLGKPAGADLSLGLATAPLIFAWKDTPALGPLVGRRFAHEGDVRRARELVLASTGLDQTRALAQEYADKARDAIRSFPASEAKTGLEEMCVQVTQRRR